MHDPDAHRTASLDQWERSAVGWAARRDTVQRAGAGISARMIEAIDPQPGQTVLELAGGTGETGFMAAELLQPGGTLISSDFAEPMLEAARARASELGLEAVEFRALNAESLDLAAASVDAVLCRWGYMLMTDPAAALGESRRVLRPGGRLALAAWDAPERNPWAALVGAAVRRAYGAPDPDPAAPGMFAFGRPGVIEELLAQAGFLDVAVEAVSLEQAYDSFEDWWEVTLDLAVPLADLVAGLDDAGREQVRAELRGAAAPHEREGRLVFPGSCLVGSATA